MLLFCVHRKVQKNLIEEDRQEERVHKTAHRKTCMLEWVEIFAGGQFLSGGSPGAPHSRSQITANVQFRPEHTVLLGPCGTQDDPSHWKVHQRPTESYLAVLRIELVSVA